MTYFSPGKRWHLVSRLNMRRLLVLCYDLRYCLSPGTTCKMVAVVTYYSFLSSFSWLLVMAFDVWRTLRLSTVHLRVVSTESRWYIFASYCALCWIVLPGILVSTALSMEYFQVDSAFWPGLVPPLWIESRSKIKILIATVWGTNVLKIICKIIIKYSRKGVWWVH